MEDKKIKTFEELVEFLKDRYLNYEVVEYPEIESHMVQVGEESDGTPIGKRQAEHVYDNLGFINRKTKVEEVTLPHMGFNSFQGFNNIDEIINFLDNKLLKECEDERRK